MSTTESRKAAYREYLLSPQWKEKREAALKRAGHRCQVCYSEKRLEVHHRTYERVRDEAPTDLTVLCSDCHQRFHGVKRTSEKPGRIQKKKLPKVPPFLIACPTCLAPQGQPCVSPMGATVKAHSQRRAAARRDAGAVALQSTRTRHERGALATSMAAMKDRNAAAARRAA